MRQLPSAGELPAPDQCVCALYSEDDAGVNFSRNLMLASSENGPQGTSVLTSPMCSS